MRKHAEIESAFADRALLDGIRSFFLVGIGGAGMSALARMLRHRGYDVVGTDSTQSPETDRLISEGISVRIGHTGEGLTERHAVVLTDAIDLGASPEVARAREIGAPLFRRSQVLGWLLRGHKVIAVTGTHGKTTTTGMIGAGLRAAGMDPLIVVGAGVPDFGGPVVEGEGEWAVVEACEAYDSFHDLDPTVVVLTNLELDHIDFHGSWENLRASVARFVEKVGRHSDGKLIYCADDPGAAGLAGEFQQGGRSAFSESGYSLHNDEPAFRPMAIPLLRMPGEHNALNAQGALRACVAAGADDREAAQGIANFGGAERRLQVLQEQPVTIIDDYAHHPTEIEASLRAINDRYPYRRVIVVYQPHLYSRTEPLIKEFADALSVADEVVLTDIYPAREDPIPGVSSARIAELVTKPVRYVPNRHLLPRKVAAMARSGDVVVGMGAGNIAEFAQTLIEELKRGFSASPRGGGGRRVAVIYGGNSAEREVSILSGREVAAALKRKGHRVDLVDVAECLIRSGDVSRFRGEDRPDAAFLAVHGSFDEGGGTQGLFEMLHIPYTGSGLVASAVAMDKELTKTMLGRAGIRVPEGALVTSPEEEVDVKGPWVVKPNALGSTVGLSFVKRSEDLKPAIAKALQYDAAALVEEWIVGMETSTPVIGDRALPTVEIAPKAGAYDFANKYTPGATEEICPARLPEEVRKECEEIALRAHRALGCAGATRTDMIVRAAAAGDLGDPTSEIPNYEIVTLEINTLPGMTATSLLPNSARTAGIEFDDLVEWLLEDALERYARQA